MLHQLLATLRELNVRLFVENGNLKCKAPPGTLNAELAQAISAQKDELLAVLASSQDAETIRIVSGQRHDPIPLSFAQQRLWFLDQLQPDSPFYNIPLVLRLCGRLDVAALERSFEEIVRRHEVLRTVFDVGSDGEPVQVVLPSLAVVVERIDLTGLAESAAVCRDLCREAAAKPFDLRRGPLICAGLLMLGDSGERQEAVLMLTMHHIVSDGWSAEVLVKEFTSLYRAFSQGQVSPLADLAIQYADFACWQRRCLVGGELERQLDYWRQRLDGASFVLDLPTDRPRPAVMTYCGASLNFEIPLPLAQRVREVGKQHNVTLFMLMLAVFELQLSRYSGQNDICVGTPVANRHRHEVEDLIGFFVNTLVLRGDLSANPCFADFLTQVKTSVLDAQHHQNLPFEKLVEALQPERDPSRSPLFQAMFVLANQDKLELSLPGLEISVPEGRSEVAKFDLTLHIQDWPDGRISGMWEYNTDLFDADTIVRFDQHYRQLLEAAVERPQMRVSELPLLNEAEKRQILEDWNATETDYPQECCIHQLIEAQVEQTPDAVALSFENKRLTYAELNAKANQLAHYLIERGVGPEVLIGICIERSLEMVIGLLGILKAGGAYVPLDPNYPEERLAFMLDDIAPIVVLTQAKFIGRDFGRAQTLSLDSDWTTIETYSAVNPKPDIRPENLAYCIYTSGSTGRPKGAGVPHQGILNRLQWMQAEYRLDAGDKVLQKTPYNFDVSVWEFFWPLMTGARLVVAAPELHKDSQGLIELIRREGITTIHFVPSMLQAFVETPDVEQCGSLKRVICSGEALPADLVQRFQQKLPTELHNLYGPTEASVDVSYWACPEEWREAAIPIGRPIANIRLYILDRSLNPVPTGTHGELHIAGIGLGRGYQNRPALTAEKFIPDPFGAAGSRMYKTGDLVRHRSDGNIDYLGRIDHQVKIRGLRIELGEIEAQLIQQSAVKEAVVIAREDQPGDKRLVAYLIEERLGTLQLDELKVQLKQILPDYMVPSAFVVLEQMPVSTNGKLDRNKLPAPNLSEQLKKAYVAPCTITEQVLAEIWQEVLGVEQVGSEDDFFALGGHSLLATQSFFLAQKRLATTVTFKAFLTEPTIAAQACLIDERQTFEPSIDLEAEAVLDASLVPVAAGTVDVAAARTLLLTGATGFLGAFLLADLLALTQTKVFCLVRAESQQQAMSRLRRQIEQYELSDRVDFSRVVAVCGDLAEPQLGLSERDYRDIAEQAEVIYHNGALVNFVQPYQALKAANVSGTEEVLRLATFGKAKAIHYVSTVSVFSEPPTEITGHQETDEPVQRGNLPNGYAQSKWVAEKLVVAARERGFQVSIYRPAIVAGDSRSGAWNSSDFWCRLIKGCIQMGYAPCERVRIDMAPVDYMSRAIVTLSRQADAIGRIFHLNHPQPPYSDHWLDCFESLGYRIERISYRDWLQKTLEIGLDNPAFALASLLPTFFEQLRNGNTQLSDDEGLLYDCRETHQALSELGQECEEIGRNVMVLYQAYFVRSGFLPAVNGKN